MSIAERLSRRAKLSSAAGILLLKAALGLWASIALVTASADNEKSFLGETIRTREPALAVLLLVLTGITVAVAVQLVRLRPWARTAAVVLEILAIALAVSRIGSATGAALVAIVLSVAVIVLVLTAREPD
jgi:hypothetical protein